ncbi:hypothetical protein SAMN05661077_0154 [Thiohalorhabdus denitrificans]|uniref:Uncharacterized protein n=1 Tax=Thiohalorhabdus denitrificans TaxID=381306 RepID=A0A1G5HXM3_9GAMM|nr:hypothetical protein SAMN05661077_0154 [Thiohalorhabdus denitrificans]
MGHPLSFTAVLNLKQGAGRLIGDASYAGDLIIGDTHLWDTHLWDTHFGSWMRVNRIGLASVLVSLRTSLS